MACAQAKSIFYKEGMTKPTLDQIISGKRPKPLRVLIYGPGGIGKSYWAAQWRNSLVLDIEDGLGGIDCASLPLKGAEWATVIDALEMLANEEHEYKTVVIDSLDWLERLMHLDICIQRGCASIGDIQYGAGYVQALTYFEKLVKHLEDLREQGMNIVLICHAATKEVKDPTAQLHNKWQLALHKQAAEKMYQWSDCTLFAKQEITILTEKKDFGGQRKRAGGGERRMYCNDSPTYQAKNRYDLPDEMPLDYEIFRNHITNYFKEGTDA